MARYQRTEADTKAIEEWLAKGNKITVCEPYARTEDIGYMSRWKGSKKKKKVDIILFLCYCKV